MGAFSFSPDGTRLAFMQQSNSTAWDLWILPLDMSDPEHPKAGRPEPFRKTPAGEQAPAFSPDGRWLAYHSDESGRPEVYAEAYAPAGQGSGGRWQVSSSGGRWPDWSRDGRQLFFVADDQIMVASITAAGQSLQVGKPRAWSSRAILDPGNWRIFDMAPDSEHALAFQAPSSGEQAPLRVMVIQNFLDELRRRIPVK